MLSDAGAVRYPQGKRWRRILARCPRSLGDDHAEFREQFVAPPSRRSSPTPSWTPSQVRGKSSERLHGSRVLFLSMRWGRSELGVRRSSRSQDCPRMRKICLRLSRLISLWQQHLSPRSWTNFMLSSWHWSTSTFVHFSVTSGPRQVPWVARRMEAWTQGSRFAAHSWLFDPKEGGQAHGRSSQDLYYFLQSPGRGPGEPQTAVEWCKVQCGARQVPNWLGSQPHRWLRPEDPRERGQAHHLLLPRSSARARKNKARREKQKELLQQARAQNSNADRKKEQNKAKLTKDSRIPAPEWQSITSFKYSGKRRLPLVQLLAWLSFLGMHARMIICAWSVETTPLARQPLSDRCESHCCGSQQWGWSSGARGGEWHSQIGVESYCLSSSHMVVLGSCASRCSSSRGCRTVVCWDILRYGPPDECVARVGCQVLATNRLWSHVRWYHHRSTWWMWTIGISSCKLQLLEASHSFTLGHLENTFSAAPQRRWRPTPTTQCSRTGGAGNPLSWQRSSGFSGQPFLYRTVELALVVYRLGGTSLSRTRCSVWCGKFRVTRTWFIVLTSLTLILISACGVLHLWNQRGWPAHTRCFQSCEFGVMAVNSHIKLKGQVWSAQFKRWVFRTKLAQEYPWQMCQAMAHSIAQIMEDKCSHLADSFRLQDVGERKRPLGQLVPFREHKQALTALFAQAAGYQLKRGALKPLLDVETTPGAAIEWALRSHILFRQHWLWMRISRPCCRP